VNDITAWIGIGTAALTVVVLVLKAIPGEQPGETALTKILAFLRMRK